MRGAVSARGAAKAAPEEEPVRRAPSKRVPGGDPMANPSFKAFVDKLRKNSREFDADGRVLRLKRYLPSNASSAMINIVLDALKVNTRVEALYIQNFEEGFFDDQLERLTQVLKLKRIWCLNVGENFRTSLEAWKTFASHLHETAVAYMYASEHHFIGTDLKTQMRDTIRVTRKANLHRYSPEVAKQIGNMWFNPRPDGASGRSECLSPAACNAGGKSRATKADPRAEARRAREIMIVSAAALRAAIVGRKQDAKGGTGLIRMRGRLWRNGAWVTVEVSGFHKSTGQHRVEFPKGEEEFLSLGKERIEWIGLEGHKDLPPAKAAAIQKDMVNTILDASGRWKAPEEESEEEEEESDEEGSAEGEEEEVAEEAKPAPRPKGRRAAKRKRAPSPEPPPKAKRRASAVLARARAGASPAASPPQAKPQPPAAKEGPHAGGRKPVGNKLTPRAAATRDATAGRKGAAASGAAATAAAVAPRRGPAPRRGQLAEEEEEEGEEPAAPAPAAAPAGKKRRIRRRNRLPPTRLRGDFVRFRGDLG